MIDVVTTVLIPLGSSLAVGMASAYLTARTSIAVFKTRLESVEDRLTHLGESHEALKEERSKDGERLVRLETKIDILLMGTQ